MTQYKVYIVCDIFNKPVVWLDNMYVFPTREQAEAGMEYCQYLGLEASHISESEILLADYVVN